MLEPEVVVRPRFRDRMAKSRAVLAGTGTWLAVRSLERRLQQ